ncbi:hypothetical protein P0Y31_01175 [Knoellia sp. 3-2P3]|uniref:hypothetical protein n=1 Tax=unclassified Knoellia TaxID=2618719 RepID=UPI0023DB7AB5|nr:hypothetical protein [Knoellia sp. 3-2P3]MDF2090944.1 hypothetical protein [Knoellia sp. 3-2P3]
MDEGEAFDTQWTPEAKQAYVACADELIEALRTHVAANIRRTGRQKELGPYVDSAETLVTVAHAFEDAEFNWCGSFPLGLGAEDDLELDDEDEEEVPEGRMLSVFRRWDLDILDEAAVIAAGRAAYLRAWPDDTEEDASLRVQDVEMAASEIIHADGIDALGSTEGLEAERGATTIVQHGKPARPLFRRKSDVGPDAGPAADDRPAGGGGERQRGDLVQRPPEQPA